MIWRTHFMTYLQNLGKISIQSECQKTYKYLVCKQKNPEKCSHYAETKPRMTIPWFPWNLLDYLKTFRRFFMTIQEYLSLVRCNNFPAILNGQLVSCVLPLFPSAQQRGLKISFEKFAWKCDRPPENLQKANQELFRNMFSQLRQLSSRQC